MAKRHGKRVINRRDTFITRFVPGGSLDLRCSIRTWFQLGLPVDLSFVHTSATVRVGKDQKPVGLSLSRRTRRHGDRTVDLVLVRARGSPR